MKHHLMFIVAAALLSATSACANQSPAETAEATKAAEPAAPRIEIKATDLGSGIWMTEGEGGNIGVLTGPDGTFVIDSQYDRISAENLAKIEEIAGQDGLRFLVNTHWHGDHAGGNAAFKGDGATIIAQDNVRARLTTDQTLTRFGQTSTTEAAPADAWPVITFPAGMTLFLNGQTIDLIHLPAAHTDGDTMIRFREANIIHTGDVMFSGRFPFIDTGSGGSTKGYIAGLDRIYALANDETVIMPGHGPISRRADVKALADMLRSASATLRPLAASGKTLEEVQAINPLASLDETWSWQFITTERFTAGLYDDLQRELGK